MYRLFITLTKNRKRRGGDRNPSARLILPQVLSWCFCSWLASALRPVVSQKHPNRRRECPRTAFHLAAAKEQGGITIAKDQSQGWPLRAGPHPQRTHFLQIGPTFHICTGLFKCWLHEWIKPPIRPRCSRSGTHLETFGHLSTQSDQPPRFNYTELVGLHLSLVSDSLDLGLFWRVCISYTTSILKNTK